VFEYWIKFKKSKLAFGGIWTHECEHSATWVHPLGPLGHKCLLLLGVQKEKGVLYNVQHIYFYYFIAINYSNHQLWHYHFSFKRLSTISDRYAILLLILIRITDFYTIYRYQNTSSLSIQTHFVTNKIINIVNHLEKRVSNFLLTQM
jgi:hypothetical protein